MSSSRNALFSAALLLSLGTGCTCGIFDAATTRFQCSSDDDCAEGFTCQPGAGNAKECVAGAGPSLQANGASCTAGQGCESGFCVDGRCCESACDGACEACVSSGRCLPKPSGTTCGADYVCDGTARTCPSSCTEVAQCASAHDCVGNACVDLDECTTSGICGANATCANTPGSWECSCSSGFLGATTMGAPATCADVDECSSNPDCGPLATCTNIPGSYECGCPTGTFGATVTGGPTSCSTVDRCTTPGMCGANATCATTATSYSCTCNAGYSGAVTMGAPATCVDANECASPTSACGPNASCTNTTGSYQCACASGFMGSATTGMPATCTDVDECPSVSCGANASCTNSPGSYVCSCDANFMGAPVTGGPAVCTAIDRCTGVSCGANATCGTVPGSYTCTCDSGFSGATVTGGPATCTDVDECAIPGGSCGANASCANTPPGSYTCTCVAGTTGATTVGMPATCVAGPITLGVAEGPGTLVITLAQAVSAGTKVALAYTAETTGSVTVTDPRGNTWTRVAFHSGCAACGSAGLYTSTLTNGWVAGDAVTLGTSSGFSGAWLTSLAGYVFLDQVGQYSGFNNDSTPTLSTPAAITDPDELLIAVLGTEEAVVLTSAPDGGFATQVSFTDSQHSGIIASKVASGLSGVQTYGAFAMPGERFSGVIAAFYGGVQTPPSGFSLSHTANNRAFTLSWTAGRGNGGASGCAVQYRNSSGTWVTLSNTSCDTSAVNRSFSLPAGTNWYGASWSSVSVRLLRVDDQVVLHTFSPNLTCMNRAASSTSTPTIDEDCDGAWDDRTCSTFSWVMGTVYPTTFTACTNSGDTTATKSCTSTNESETRYTEGMSTPSPASVFSSSTYGSACTGAYTGATTWTCTASNCTYR